MGMHVSVEIVDIPDAERAIHDTFAYFRKIDNKYSTYKPTSEITRINNGLPKAKWSPEMRHIMELCEQTKADTSGFFDIHARDGTLDPSGLVKGWAIKQAADRLLKRGVTNFYIDAGGDIQAIGTNEAGERWTVGIRNPYDLQMVVKIIGISGEGVATSGTYIRGQHVYDPHHPQKEFTEVKSLTVIGPNIYEADRFATAAFAMGKDGISFIESLPGFEGYMIDRRKTATFTNGFERYVINV